MKKSREGQHADAHAPDVEALADGDEEEDARQDDRRAHEAVSGLPRVDGLFERLRRLLASSADCSPTVLVLVHQARAGRRVGVVQGIELQPGVEGDLVLGSEAALEDVRQLLLTLAVACSHALNVPAS